MSHFLARAARLARSLRYLPLLTAAALGLSRPAAAQSFLHADGGRIVNASNQEVLLNGVNLGGWALQEGYIVKPGWPGINGKQTQGAVKQALYQAGMSDADVETFYQNYRNNFITKPDIDFLAAKGFNCLRLPLHYDLFLTPQQRAVRNSVLRGTTTYAAYVQALSGWYQQNQLFTDLANMEAFRMIDDVLGWAAANNMYVVLDLHAAPGSQGTDANIADSLTPLDLWNQPVYQDITERLWTSIAARYRQDARIAMYDLINEPNNVPSNQQIRTLLQRLINAVRAQNDDHLLLLEGNGWGNDYNFMERRNFSNNANLVYSSHRYSGATYPLDNNVNSADPGNANNLRTIGNLTRFRTDNTAPIWVGETGENTDQWMHDAAVALNSVRIGWCHWTYKRFENSGNAALMRIPPPYIVDGPAGLPQVLQNIRFGGALANSALDALAPNQNGIVNYPGGGSYNGLTAPPLQRIVWLQGSNGKYVSSEGGYQPMTCVRATSGLWEQFAVEPAGAPGLVALRSRATNGYVSVPASGAPLTCTSPAVTAAETFEWLINADGSISLRGNNGRYVSSEHGTAPLSCTRSSISFMEKFTFGISGSTALSTAAPRRLTASFYPNPTTGTLTYQLPDGRAHELRVLDAAGRVVLRRAVPLAAAPARTLDLAGLRAGLYRVELQGADFRSSFTVSKQ
jgi:endoglucanase